MRVYALSLALLLTASLPSQAGHVPAASTAVELGFDSVTGEPVRTASPELPVQGTLAAHITSAGPLTDIWIGEELSCQVRTVWAPDTAEFYPSTHGPADCGTFVAVGGVLYGPDFANHDGTSAITYLGPGYVPFTPVSQTTHGTGTGVNDPFVVVTEVGLGSTPYLLTQIDSYVPGEFGYRTQIAMTDTTLLKNGKQPVQAIVYHAGDCNLFGNDSGFGSGIFSPIAMMCMEEDMQPAMLYVIEGAQGAYDVMEEDDETVWQAVASQIPLSFACECDPAHDNALAVSWEVTVPSQVSVLVGRMASAWFTP